MSPFRSCHRWILLTCLMASLVQADDTSSEPGTGETKVSLIFQGGHDTDPRDHGRPVVLIAAALGVPPAAFRDAFSHVHPAPAGGRPDAAEVQNNKRALLERLGPYGVTNDRLDEVSNYYRYRPQTGEMWRHVDAAGFAIVRGGKMVAIQVTEPGAGYSSPPMVSVSGVGLTVYPLAILSFETDLSRNGSISRIDLAPIADSVHDSPILIGPRSIQNVPVKKVPVPPAP